MQVAAVLLNVCVCSIVFGWLWFDFQLLAVSLFTASRSEPKQKRNQKRSIYAQNGPWPSICAAHSIKSVEMLRINFKDFLFYLHSFYGQPQIFEEIMHLVVAAVVVVSIFNHFSSSVYLSPCPFTAQMLISLSFTDFQMVHQNRVTLCILTPTKPIAIGWLNSEWLENVSMVCCYCV